MFYELPFLHLRVRTNPTLQSSLEQMRRAPYTPNARDVLTKQAPDPTLPEPPFHLCCYKLLMLALHPWLKTLSLDR